MRGSAAATFYSSVSTPDLASWAFPRRGICGAGLAWAAPVVTAAAGGVWASADFGWAAADCWAGADCWTGSAAAAGLAAGRALPRACRRQRRLAFGIGTVRLATCGTVPAAAAGPDLGDRRQRAGRTIVHVKSSLKLSPIRRAGMKRMIRPVRASMIEPAVLAAAVDHRNRVDEAALPRDAERRKSALAHHRVDLGGRQQHRPLAVARPGVSRGGGA